MGPALLYANDAEEVWRDFMLGWLKKLLQGSEQSGSNADPSQSQCPPLAVLVRYVPMLGRLPVRDQKVLPGLIERFLAEKQFWGAEDLRVTERIKVTVAAQACVLILRRPEFWVYPKTREVILYPSEFGERITAIAPDGTPHVIEPDKVGETWNRGPVLLSWDRLQERGGFDDAGHNTVFHEFAHAIDFLDGDANGLPPMESPEDRARWHAVMTEAYEALTFAVRNGRRTFLDPYGATNPAEFFAVATEQFFAGPRRLRRAHSAVYAALRDFYKQDPASW